MATPAEGTQSGRPRAEAELGVPRVELSVTELATITMLVEGAHTMNSAQSRLALARGEVLDSALRQLKLALTEAGAVQDGIGWRPRTP